MRSKAFLKVGAVLSSALLMATFVAYRAGAFSGLTANIAPTTPTDPTPTAPKEKTAADAAPACRVGPRTGSCRRPHAPVLSIV